MTHECILTQIDIQNLVNKMVDIFIYKIGGSPEKRKIYQFEVMCTHYQKARKGMKGIHCIQDEFCEHGHLIPRDLKTIQTGFNIYQVLIILNKMNPGHPKMECFQRDMQKYNYLQQNYNVYEDNIFKETVSAQ